MTIWIDMEPLADARIEVKTETVRAILRTIVQKSPAVINQYCSLEAAAQIQTSEMEIAYRLWFAAQVHQGDTMSMDNRLFTAFTKLCAMADELGADLELPADIDQILNTLPQPDAAIKRVKLPGNPD